MADAPTNLMAKYYVQESSGDYSSQSVSIFMMETSGTLEGRQSAKGGLISDSFFTLAQIFLRKDA